MCLDSMEPSEISSQSAIALSCAVGEVAFAKHMYYPVHPETEIFLSGARNQNNSNTARLKSVSMEALDSLLGPIQIVTMRKLWVL